MAFSAIYDACVLYPFEIRDVLMTAALTRCFTLYWTEAILDECARNLIADGRATEENMKAMKDGMNSVYPYANAMLPTAHSLRCPKLAGWLHRPASPLLLDKHVSRTFILGVLLPGMIHAFARPFEKSKSNSSGLALRLSDVYRLPGSITDIWIDVLRELLQHLDGSIDVISQSQPHIRILVKRDLVAEIGGRRRICAHGTANIYISIRGQ